MSYCSHTHTTFLAYIPQILRTGQLIGVASVDMTAPEINEELNKSRLYEGASEIAIVRYNNGTLDDDGTLYDDGTVFADTMGLSLSGELPKIYETDFMTKESYVELRKLVEVVFSEPWTPQGLQDALDGIYFVCQESGVHTAFPIPLPPRDYDASYRPKFIVLHSVSNEVFSAVDAMDDKIAEDFKGIALASCGLGVLGMIIVVLIVWFVSNRLTQPLLWIDKVSWNIVNHKSERADESLRVKTADDENLSTLKCASRTEITQLVSEFRNMLTGFSGSGASTVALSKPSELPNEMTWRSDFQQLYKMSSYAKRKKSFRQRTNGTSGTSKTDEDTISNPSSHGEAVGAMLPKVDDVPFVEDTGVSYTVPAPPKKNVGHNIVAPSDNLNKKNELENEFSVQKIHSYRSSLFWWILILIAIPLVLTNIIICTLVSKKMVSTVPDWVTIVEEASLKLERDSLKATAGMEASVAADMIHEVVRDLHFMTRMAGWLLFGGVERSGTLVDMDEYTEDCKNYPEDRSCPFFSSGRAVCPCDWEHYPPKGACKVFPEGFDTRSMQRRMWLMQAVDSDETGARFSASSFPEMSSRSNNTLWWNTTEDLPGAWKGRNASGFETAYDRIRVTSAMALVDVPVYNYKTALGRRKHDIGSYLSFEADGSLSGYDGCDFDNDALSRWKSTEGNHAAEIAPHLCPLGKHGYDSRCREWYDTAKQKSLTEGAHIHLTAPYEFAGDDFIASSATSPIFHPGTKEYVGQVLLDFAPTAIRDSLRRLRNSTTSFVITPDPEAKGGDTLIGPDQSSEVWESANILDLLFRDETSGSSNKQFFEREILPHMKAGKANVTTYSRWRGGEPEELLVLAYHPVRVRAYQALRPDDFSRGVNESETLVYSVGIARKDEDLRRPFENISDDVMDDLDFLRLLYASLVMFVSVLFTVYTCLVSYFVEGRHVLQLWTGSHNISPSNRSRFRS